MVKRTSHRLLHDPSRVIAKPYLPGEEIFTDTATRAGLLMARILALPEDEVARVLGETVARFSDRHRRFEELLERHFALVAHRVPPTSRCRESDACSSARTSRTSTRSSRRALQSVDGPAPDQNGVASRRACASS